jgi:hypothetical protein
MIQSPEPSSPDTADVSLENLAETINSEHDACQQAGRNSVQHAASAGRAPEGKIAT